MATFGNTGLPSGTTEEIENDIWGSVFTMPEDGNADSMTVKIIAGSVSSPMQCAIYKDSDKSFVAKTAEKSITADYDGEETFNFSGSPALDNGVDYVLCIWGDSVSGTPVVYCNASGGDSRNDAAIYATPNPSWPIPLNSYDKTLDIAIYCTYTVAAAGTNMTVNVDDAYKDVASAYVNVDDAWKTVANAYVNKDDAWKTIF